MLDIPLSIHNPIERYKRIWENNSNDHRSYIPQVRFPPTGAVSSHSFILRIRYTVSGFGNLNEINPGSYFSLQPLKIQNIQKPTAFLKGLRFNFHTFRSELLRFIRNYFYGQFSFTNISRKPVRFSKIHFNRITFWF
jgi:hypothetical protein